MYAVNFVSHRENALILIGRFVIQHVIEAMEVYIQLSFEIYKWKLE